MNVRHGVTLAFRSLRRAPAFSAAVVLTLTIGIGSATTIFAIVNAVLLRPLPYGHSDRLVGVWNDLPSLSLMHAQQTSSIYFTFQRYARTIDGIGLYDDGSVSVTDPDGRADPERMSAAWTTANLVPLLQVSPIIGRSFTDAEDAPKGPSVAMISEGLWRTRYGGDKSVLGKRLLIGGQSTEIVGVMPASFRFPDADTRIWMPRQLDPNAQYSGGFSHFTIARLRPGVTIDAAQRDFANVLPRVVDVMPNLAPGATTKMMLDQAKPVPRIIPLRDDVVGDISRTLWMVAATAGLLLLVTCANVANLLLVRADGRHRELSVRAALGAGQSRVLGYFFTESAVLAAVSTAAGSGVAAIAIGALVHAGPAQIPRLSEVRVDAAVVFFALVVGALVSAACSAVPAVRFLRSDPLGGLRDGGRGGTVGSHRQRARSTLVAAQMALALVVVAASGLLLRSYQRLHAVRPGFNADGVATLWVSLPSSRYSTDTSIVQFYSRLTERAAHLPGVTAAGITSHLPLATHGMDEDPMWIEGDASGDTKIPPLELYVSADSGYFRVMDVPLIAGKMFDRVERQHGNEVIVSLETARFFFHDSTGRSAIGKRFRSLPGAPWMTIVGVVGSTRDTSLSVTPARTVYFPEAFPVDTVDNQLKRTMALVARTNGDVTAAARSMRGLVHDLDPTLPTFDSRSMRDVSDASIAQLSFTMIVLGVAAGVTLLLGVIGLYGVIAYVVTLRTRELGVRIALGAQPSSVEAMVTRQGLVLSAMGIGVGLVLTIILARFLRSFLFEIAPTDPLTLAGASGTLVIFALLASWIPARRAARVNPTEALRSD